MRGEKHNLKEIIQDFSKWTSYFGGFNDNRANIYTKEDIPTSICYRIVHDNLPKFLANLGRYQKAKELSIDFEEVNTLLKKQNITLDGLFCLEGFNQCLTQKGIDTYLLALGGKKENKKQLEGIKQIINKKAQKIDSKIDKLDKEQDKDKIEELKKQKKTS